MQKYYFLAVDYQYDFAGTCGKNRVIGRSPEFIEDTLIPFLHNNHIPVNEIVSDYRLPRGKSVSESCVPGTKGYESLLPSDLRCGNSHIKCMHNPLWTRNGIGDENALLGKEYQDVLKFDSWVTEHFPNKNIPIILFGETMECCILSVSQELYFRGYNIFVLYEATDPMPERQTLKEMLMSNSSLSIYAKRINFIELEDQFSE